MMAKTLDFAMAKAHRTKEVPEYTIELNPEDMGLSLTPEEMGVDANGKVNKTIAVLFRPFNREEYNDILEQIKDEKGTGWVDEKDFAIVQLCLLQPAIPPTAEGRKFLEGWLPGTVANLRQQIEEHSGYRRNYYVEKATDALKNSASTPKTSTSNSK
ncbi:MAG: hypothetical protein LC793_16385 [Thermomicrobia bacterium]|nr:hypothetical protein [Thermomicrobia bacterium]